MNKTRNLSCRALVAAGLVALTLAAPMQASAGKPAPSGTGSTIELVVLNDIDNLPNHGGLVTFTVTTTNTKPFVSLNCYQGGVWVYAASAGFFSGYPWSTDFTLASGSWPSGDAECTARLYSTKDGTRTTTLAPLLKFHVSA